MAFNASGFRDMGRILVRARKALDKTFNASFMKEIGEFSVKKIKTRTQLGRGVAKDRGPEGKFIPLATSTKLWRQGRIAFYTDSRGQLRRFKPDTRPFLSDKTSPGRSNLTRTGQMLESMFVKSFKNRQVTLGVKDSRRGGIARPGGASSVKNSDLVAWHEAGAGKLPKRPFFHLSSGEVSQIEGKARRRLKKEFDKL